MALNFNAAWYSFMMTLQTKFMNEKENSLWLHKACVCHYDKMRTSNLIRVQIGRIKNFSLCDIVVPSCQFIMGTLSSLHKCTKSMEQNQGSNHAKFDFNSSQLRSQTSYLILTFNALSSIFCPHSLDSWSNPYSSVLTFYFLKNYSQANEKTIA